MRAPITSKSRGFSMIEVLVAMVVLSIGMLGMAALYTTGFKTGRSALLRSKGVIFAADMADRIRANQVGAATYEATDADDGVDNGCGDYFDGAAVVAAVACTPDEMALHDLFLWKQTLTDPRAGLPNATATIDRDAAAVPVSYTITVNWTEGDEEFSYTLDFQG